ncbi:MAG: hypothetical protein JXA24_06315 [Proteobacteria bacterium]|nr:hypothetical protein [Pseudomonadota bacterium]
MRIVFALLAAALMVVASGPAQAIEVVSANGFTCTQQPAPGNRSLVECIGQFPGVAGLFAGTGYDIVHVEYSPDNKKRYFFMSETGCLILNASDNTALATDRSGTKKQFPAFMDAMGWCYGGGQPAPAPKQQPSQVR